MKKAQAFLAVLVWDYLATVGTRLIVDESLWAIALAAAVACLWYWSVRLVQKDVGLAPFLLAAVLGTLGGIMWP